MVLFIVLFASVRFAGTKWIDKLLPPIIIGPMDYRLSVLDLLVQL